MLNLVPFRPPSYVFPFFWFFFFILLFVGCIEWGCPPCRSIPKVGGCWSCFWYTFSMFHPKAFLFVVHFSPPLFQAFGINLRLLIHPLWGFWEAPRVKFFSVALSFPNALVDSFPIFSGRVGFISFKVIMPTTYLGSWVLVALVIALTFLVDSRSFD